MPVTYHCPGCHTTNQIHTSGCRYGESDIHTIESVMATILALVTSKTAVSQVMDGSTTAAGTTEPSLRETFDDWGPLHDGVLRSLVTGGYVERDGDTLRALDEAERKDHIQPTGGDIGLVLQYGACNGCLDHGVSAVVSWHEMEGFSWEETKERAIEWLHETGTWERGEFAEPTPEALVESKAHIHQEGHGWATFAENTARRMRDAGYLDE